MTIFGTDTLLITCVFNILYMIRDREPA